VLGRLDGGFLLCPVVARGRQQWHVVGCRYVGMSSEDTSARNRRVQGSTRLGAEGKGTASWSVPLVLHYLALWPCDPIVVSIQTLALPEGGVFVVHESTVTPGIRSSGGTLIVFHSFSFHSSRLVSPTQ
jgi:hypothetical protein